MLLFRARPIMSSEAASLGVVLLRRVARPPSRQYCSTRKPSARTASPRPARVPPPSPLPTLAPGTSLSTVLAFFSLFAFAFSVMAGAAVLGGLVSGVLLPVLIVVAFSKFLADGSRWLLYSTWMLSVLCVTYTCAAIVAVFSLASGDWVSCVCDAGCAARLAGGGVAMLPAHAAFICAHAPFFRVAFYLGLAFAVAAVVVEVAIMREVALLLTAPCVLVELGTVSLLQADSAGAGTGLGAPAAGVGEAAAAAAFACEEGGAEPGKAAADCAQLPAVTASTSAGARGAG